MVPRPRVVKVLGEYLLARSLMGIGKVEEGRIVR